VNNPEREQKTHRHTGGNVNCETGKKDERKQNRKQTKNGIEEVN
jgi:hypothetical protein